MTPAISVIIPAYKVERYIADCLDSVMGQQGAPTFEVIVVNDCSPDKSAEIASRYDGVKVLHHTENKGLSEARNTGIRTARGHYLYFVDSDDTIAPDALARLWKHAEAHPNVDIVYGMTAAVPGNRSMNRYYDLTNRNARPFESETKRVRRLHIILPEIACNRLISREWMLGHNLFFTPGLIHEDFDWHLRALDRVQTFAIETGKPTYHHLLRNDSITGLQTDLNKRRVSFDILIKNIDSTSALDRPMMRIIAAKILDFKYLVGDESDVRQMADLYDAMRRHKSFTALHNIVLKMLKSYPQWLPRKNFFFLPFRTLSIQPDLHT